MAARAPNRAKAQTFEQILLTRYPKSEIKRLVITEDKITKIKLEGFTPSSGGNYQPIGLSVGYDPKGNLELFAICDSAICLVVQVSTSANELDRAERAALLQQYVFCRDAGEIFGFDLDAAAIAMLHILNVHIARGVDIQTALADQVPERVPLDCLKCCIGDDTACKKIGLSVNNVKGAFKHEYRDEKDELGETHFIAVTQRAWAAQFVATYQNAAFTFSDVKYIETINFSPQLITVIIDMLETTRRVTNIGPKGGDHRFTKAQSEEDSQVSIRMGSFAQRFQGGEEVVLVQLNTIGERITRFAVVSEVTGKNATFEFMSGQRITIANNDKSLVSVKSITRSPLTNADKKTRARIRAVLLGDLELFADNVWVHNILIAHTTTHMKPWPNNWSLPTVTSPILPEHLKHPSRMSLNRSQKHVVDAMLDPVNPITIVQGPPGTGKTSTLAAFVKVALAAGRSGIWLIAQSNVAVKNIAEKLIKVGFSNFKLLVSSDFELWHDHLYTTLTPCIIRSTTFRTVQRKEFAATQVFIATLSMLSSRFISKFMSVVPLRTLVVDEASQIKVSEYINVFTSFKDTLQKMCFIGDPKQLPPYGADDVKQVQSIFELEHLKDICLMLDTQYRMPPQLGAFISKEVYDNKLMSWDDHPVQPDTPALFFIDVPTGGERQNEKKSFENNAEAEIAIQLAALFQQAGHHHRIITPYAGQTELIENLLKERDLEWDDKCFNVDSFQGNEDDYIIISLVRSQAIGFLSSLRRTNVMLSRCKKAMYIISSRKFLGKKGLETLVGRLASDVDGGAWLSVDHVAQGHIDQYVVV
ncbi:hypothetical protein CYLTODRAFT_490757 [Cylindrobasidium torrendii FP15055 ss-10]|uniref:DNA2/NAM7 helicase-like C-terminal domain-containing protein n=1 Tax=Cylindrobasidium torrendii FP15055 ss-10 TaxID=1314674 RepID=A0A0D7B9N5_9AGAR|nr:hypothetical protein CYLTODRAFT_490757 [Cylindrobasidium torrendii FP15055 ss-10]